MGMRYVGTSYHGKTNFQMSEMRGFATSRRFSALPGDLATPLYNGMDRMTEIHTKGVYSVDS